MKVKSGIIIIIAALALAAGLFSGCQIGGTEPLTKSERLEAFKADARAGRNLRSHFSGDNASNIDSSTFVDIFDESDNLSIAASSTITGDTFSFNWSTDTAGPRTANGEFTMELEGTTESWYILWINCGEGSGSHPEYP